MNEQKFANFSDVIISIGFFHKYLEIQSLRVQNPHNLPSYEIFPRHLFVYIRANASSLLFLFFESNPNLPANKIHTKTSDAAAPQSRPRRFVLRLRRHVRLSLETLSHGVLSASPG